MGNLPPMKNHRSGCAILTRRDFLRKTAATAAVFTAPLVIPARLLGASAPSRRIRVGHIGRGRIARGHDLPGVFRSGLADIVAICDLDAKRLGEGRKLVEKFYAEAGTTAPEIAAFGDYRELVARKDIDAVVVSLPDHQHAEVALRAVLASKDVYLQKPFTMTHAEGVLLRDGCEVPLCFPGGQSAAFVG